MTPFCYHRTDLPVLIGDRVVVRSLFGRKRRGVVSYVPGQSRPVHPEMEGHGFAQWAITFEECDSLVWTYAPDQLQPSRRITFLERGSLPAESLLPDGDSF